MESGAVTVRTKKFVTNRLLQRKQFVCEVIHPGLAGVSKNDLKEKLAKMYKVRRTPPAACAEGGRLPSLVRRRSLRQAARRRRRFAKALWSLRLCACAAWLRDGLPPPSAREDPRARDRCGRRCSPPPPRAQVADPSCVLLYGFKVAFGGGRSSGFGLIYDSLTAAKKYSPKYLLTRVSRAAALAPASRAPVWLTRRPPPAAVWHGQGQGDGPQAAEGAQESHEEGARAPHPR